MHLRGLDMSDLKIAAIAAVGLLACRVRGRSRSGRGPKENTGTLLGALGGAAIGSQFGGGVGGHVAGAVIGAGVGALIGNRIGAALDDEDKRRAYAARDGRARTRRRPARRCRWRNPDAAATARWCRALLTCRTGRNCRSYTQTIYIDGRPQTARGTACRNPDGTWTPLS